MSEATAERRIHTRIEFDATVSIVCADKSYRSTIQDISLKGALVHTPPDWDIPVDDSCTLEIELDNHVPITMQASVKRIDNRFIGLECESIDVESISRLRRLVELNIGDELLLERELAALIHEAA